MKNRKKYCGLKLVGEKWNEMVYVSHLVMRYDKLNKKRKAVNDFIKEQWLTNHLCFIDIENINLEC